MKNISKILTISLATLTTAIMSTSPALCYNNNDYANGNNVTSIVDTDAKYFDGIMTFSDGNKIMFNLSRGFTMYYEITDGYDKDINDLLEISDNLKALKVADNSSEYDVYSVSVDDIQTMNELFEASKELCDKKIINNSYKRMIFNYACDEYGVDEETGMQIWCEANHGPVLQTTYTNYQPKTVFDKIGDVNCDDTINVRDASFLASSLAKKNDIPVSADFNYDGISDIRDAAAIANHLATD